MVYRRVHMYLRPRRARQPSSTHATGTVDRRSCVLRGDISTWHRRGLDWTIMGHDSIFIGGWVMGDRTGQLQLGRSRETSARGERSGRSGSAVASPGGTAPHKRQARALGAPRRRVSLASRQQSSFGHGRVCPVSFGPNASPSPTVCVCVISFDTVTRAAGRATSTPAP